MKRLPERHRVDLRWGLVQDMYRHTREQIPISQARRVVVVLFRPVHGPLHALQEVLVAAAD